MQSNRSNIQINKKECAKNFSAMSSITKINIKIMLGNDGEIRNYATAVAK
jgi:hypothetical protein